MPHSFVYFLLEIYLSYAYITIVRMNETALWIMIIMYMCGTSRPKERYLEWGGGKKNLR